MRARTTKKKEVKAEVEENEEEEEALDEGTVAFMREFIEETETLFMQDETCYVHYKEMQRTDN